jgi:hypothetical protein
LQSLHCAGRVREQIFEEREVVQVLQVDTLDCCDAVVGSKQNFKALALESWADVLDLVVIYIEIDKRGEICDWTNLSQGVMRERQDSQAEKL